MNTINTKAKISPNTVLVVGFSIVLTNGVGKSLILKPNKEYQSELNYTIVQRIKQIFVYIKYQPITAEKSSERGQYSN